MRMDVIMVTHKMLVVSMTAPGTMVDLTCQAMRMIGTMKTPRMMEVVMTAPGMVVNMTRKAMELMVVWTRCQRNVGRRGDSLTMKRRLRIETRKKGKYISA